MTQKYINDHGIVRNNPAYIPPMVQAFPLHMPNESTALAVVSAPNEEEEIVVQATPLYNEAVAEYKETVEPEIYVQAENHDSGSLDDLNQVLAKYEVPAGMLSKLLDLQHFDAVEIIVDDSGSMNASTDAMGPKGERLTRWMEAKGRISQMIELMAYVRCPRILVVTFLNRQDTLDLKRHDKEAPTAYISRVEAILVNAFQSSPAGTTPALEAIKRSMTRYSQGSSVLRYFLGDGVPNGGDTSYRAIEQLLLHRPDPEKNPFTFMSCTDQDDQTEWMKECEEKAPYCSEFDDYLDESREILKDQGKAFPYSFGLHLVAQLVAAFNPHDLDAMDESVPFTRQTLDNLLGYQSSPESYKYYFDCFVQAQRQHGSMPQFQRTFVNQLPSLYQQYESSPIANDISAVAEYKRKLKLHASQQQKYPTQQQYRGSAQPQPGAECCIIL